MVNRLVVIATVGLAAPAVFIGAAAAISGGNFGDGLENMFSDKPRCEAIAGATAASRDLDWTDSDEVELAVPADAVYTRGGGDKLHATGDPQLLAHLRIEGGSIELDCRGWGRRGKELAITLPGRAFKKFAIAGTGNLALNKLDQPNLKIEIAGMGSVKANGKVDELAIEIAGSGDADFGQVVTRNARVEIAGRSTTDIAPSEDANIEIAGTGDVNLHTNPKRLETDISGAGRIHKLAGGG